MAFEITVGSAEDVARMSAWADDEGWNPGNTDGLAFQATDPGAFLIGRLDGTPLACISVVRYGAGFGFLGYYIARPEIRGKGYGIQLWRAGMARLAGRTVGLDGVVAQQDNYAKSGFVRAWNNIRYEGVPAGVPLPPPAGVTLVDARRLPFDRLAAYDRRFFPEARDSFLAPWISLPERSALAATKDGEIVGLAVMRACRAASRIGPLYGATPEIASALIGALAAGKPVAIDVPDINQPAVALVERLGLVPSFETARMYVGAVPMIDLAGLFGTTSLELG
jgi:ribosomal protein S18 acetylase RimI-like enzyme